MRSRLGIRMRDLFNENRIACVLVYIFQAPALFKSARDQTPASSTESSHSESLPSFLKYTKYRPNHTLQRRVLINSGEPTVARFCHFRADVHLNQTE